MVTGLLLKLGIICTLASGGSQWDSTSTSRCTKVLTAVYRLWFVWPLILQIGADKGLQTQPGRAATAYAFNPGGRGSLVYRISSRTVRATQIPVLKTNKKDT